MDGLHQKQERLGLRNITYMVVNHQGGQSQRLHTMLAQRVSANISLYKQDTQQADVWQALNGEKDDFLIYDRCGRLTNHLSLPYTIIGQGHIEKAIKEAYCSRTCGDCVHEPADMPEECTRAPEPTPEGEGGGEADHGHGHHSHGHHHGDHGHGHRHGDHHGVGHGQHGDREQGRGQEREASRGHVGQQGHQHGVEQMDLVHGQQQAGQQAMHMGHH